MTGDFFTKLLPGSLFRKFRAQILNLDDTPSPDQKECVGTGDTRQGPGPEEPARESVAPVLKKSYSEVAKGRVKRSYSEVAKGRVTNTHRQPASAGVEEIIFRGGEGSRHQYTSPTLFVIFATSTEKVAPHEVEGKK